MNFLVLTYRRADNDIREAVRRMAENLSPRVARSWHTGLMNAVDSLRIDPERCPLADEAGDLGTELRELRYRRRRTKTVYRILFAITGDTVNIIRVVTRRKTGRLMRTFSPSPTSRLHPEAPRQRRGHRLRGVTLGGYNPARGHDWLCVGSARVQADRSHALGKGIALVAARPLAARTRWLGVAASGRAAPPSHTLTRPSPAR